MAMTYSSLIAPKGTNSSIMNWVGYSKIDVFTVLDEAQSLIYGALRVREMRTTWAFGMQPGASSIALPDRFLDPLGKLLNVTENMRIGQKDQPVLEEQRVYEPVSGSFGASPFTMVIGSSLVTADLVAHGLTEGSMITIAGAVTASGIDLNNTFPIAEILDADTFVMDCGDQVATSTVTDGGASATYSADRLIDSTPGMWAIFNERLNFDVALQDKASFRLPYFRTPVLLSDTNQENFITKRYPKLIRIATTAAAAEQMKDDEEYSKQGQALMTMIQGINAENDLFLRGSEAGTDTPTPGDYY